MIKEGSASVLVLAAPLLAFLPGVVELKTIQDVVVRHACVATNLTICFTQRIRFAESSLDAQGLSWHIPGPSCAEQQLFTAHRF